MLAKKSLSVYQGNRQRQEENLLKQTLEVSERGIVVGVKFEFKSGIGFYSYYMEVRLGHLFILA